MLKALLIFTLLTYRGGHLGKSQKKHITTPTNHRIWSYFEAYNLLHQMLIAEHSSFIYYVSIATISPPSTLALKVLH